MSYPPVFDENTAETHELGLAEARERTKVEYRESEEQTPERTEIGAVGGSDSTKPRALIKLRASRLARSRGSSADSSSAVRDGSVEAIDRGAIAATSNTDTAPSSSINQQPEPFAPQPFDQQLGLQQIVDQQPPQPQVQIAYNNDQTPPLQ